MFSYILLRFDRSPGARDRFPRVLFLAGRFPEAREAFASGALAVPEWAFLRWVDQMLGVTGREEGPVVIQVGPAPRIVLFVAFSLAVFSPWVFSVVWRLRRRSLGRCGGTGTDRSEDFGSVARLRGLR